MEFKMVKEMENMWAIHVIEAGEVIGSEAFDNFKECADRYVEVLLENGIEDDKVEESIISLFAIDEDKYTGHIIDLLATHYQTLEDMGL